MIRAVIIRAIVLGLAIVATSAQGADENGRFAVDGAGARTCAQFLDDTAQPGAAMNVWTGYLQGFFSATNVFQEDTFDITPFQSAELSILQLRSFCTQNAEERLVNALGQLIGKYRSGRLTEFSELTQVTEAGSSVVIYQAMAPRIMAALAEQGFAPTADAPLSEMPGALRAFQKSQGLDETGLPDINTLNRLFP